MAKKRRGRPQDMSRLTRNKVVQVRLTEEEVAKLKSAAAAADMSVADFVMSGIEQSRRIVIPGAGQIYAELLRQGSNLNQALKVCHQARLDGQYVDPSGVIHAADRVDEGIDRLLELIQVWGAEISKEVTEDANHEMRSE